MEHVVGAEGKKKEEELVSLVLRKCHNERVPAPYAVFTLTRLLPLFAPPTREQQDKEVGTLVRVPS